MGDRRARSTESPRQVTSAVSPAAATEQMRAGPVLVSRRMVLASAAAARMSRLGRGQMAAAFAGLQRHRGNHYVGDVVRELRHDRLVSSSDDRCEREAERVVNPAAASADAVVSLPGTAGRAPAIARSADSSGEGVGAQVPRAIAAARGGGRPLPGPVRGPLEMSLGSDFGAVRVHTDSSADRLARTFGAVAFTTGQHIFFRRGQYDPSGRAGRRLLAHELSHVVQQRGMASPPIQRKMGLEYETDDIRTRHTNYWGVSPYKTWVPHNAGDFMMARTDYALTADIATGAQQPYSRLEFRTRAFDETKRAEVTRMLRAVTSIQTDIHAIRVATHTNRRGYGAGRLWGGQQGWLAGDGWVGLDKIPRLRGPWYHQVNYAGQLSKDATGSLQLTAGFSLQALQRLISGAQLGNTQNWPASAKQDWRQYLHGYARETALPPELYQIASRAVQKYGLNRNGGPGSLGRMAGILTVMAQMPLSQRGVTFRAGKMLAKTDYAKIISMARDSGMEFTSADLLGALLEVVNEHLQGPQVNADSPVFPHAGPPDLTKISFRQWTTSLVPPRPRRGIRPAPVDLMTRTSYPGTQPEKAALRAFGPYTHTDPGERAIFELRSIMNNPSADLPALVRALVHLMRALHR